MIQMDVCEQQVADVAHAEPSFGEPPFQHRQRRRRPWIDQRHSACAVQEGGGDDFGVAEKLQVDVVETCRQRTNHCALPVAFEGAAPLWTTPPFITNDTRCMRPMSFSGSPLTAITSANRPFWIEPIAFDAPSRSAALRVADRMASIAGIPASTI